jgi:GGDEF domain-containing protein
MIDPPFATSHYRSADAAASLAETQIKRDAFRVRMTAVLGVVALAFAIVWLIPWIPVGMRPSDYNQRTTIGVVVLGLLGVAGVVFAIRWTPMLRQEPLSELMNVLMGQSVLVRGRARFLRRLETQCQRARDERGAGFSLVVTGLPGIDRQRIEDQARFADCLTAVRGVVRVQDVVGDSEAAEIWLLLQGAGPEGCTGVADRIRDGVATPSAQRPEWLQIGYATFGVDGIDPETLFRIARRAAARPESRPESRLDVA